MTQETFRIPNISCSHCTNSIQRELLELPGVTDVKGDVKGRTITVDWKAPASREIILETLRDINYPAAV